MCTASRNVQVLTFAEDPSLNDENVVLQRIQEAAALYPELRADYDLLAKKLPAAELMSLHRDMENDLLLSDSVKRSIKADLYPSGYNREDVASEMGGVRTDRSKLERSNSLVHSCVTK